MYRGGTHNKKQHTQFNTYKGETPIEKNVIVTDEFGNKLGITYPKRAKGLIKKGRAESVSECEIRLLNHSCPPVSEDNINTVNITDSNKTIIVSTETGEVLETISTGTDLIKATEPKCAAEQNRTISFNARQWNVSKGCDKTVGSRTFITDPFDGLSEAWLLGDWNWNWSQIETRDMILEKNTDYVFTLWLNGGENDCNDSVCQLEIMFDNDYDGRSIYRLDRNYIRYTKHYKGWYLYRIPFNTGDACYTKLRFIAMRAYCALIPAKELSAYENLPEDLPQKNVPQRHNIVFGSEGFPRNCWWSANVFGTNSRGTTSSDSINHGNMNVNFKSFADNLQRRVMEEIDIDSIMEDIADEIADDFDDEIIAEQIRNEIDVDSIKEQIRNSIKQSFNS